MKHIPKKVKNKYEILGTIGEGAYGEVLKARDKESDKIVAIKYFKQDPGYFSDADLIDRELNILRSLRFENVVELIEWFRDKKRCFLVFEYVEWNMLRVLQDHPDGLQLDEVRQLSYQLFSAIHWCHTHDIIHRDIKPENLLISKNFVLKLCDFGFARFCNTQTSVDYYTHYVATRWYRSPELLIGSAYGKPVDIWACGCIMAEFATGQALFAGESDIDQLYRIQKCLGPLPSKYMEDMRRNPKFEGLKFPPIHHLDTLERRFGQAFPPDMMHLFKNTLRLYANDRLTAEQCIQHEAFLSLNKKRFQRPPPTRPKPVYNSSQSEIIHNTKPVHSTNPFTESRLSQSFDEINDIHTRHRSSVLHNNTNIDSLTDISLTNSSFINYNTKYRSQPHLTDRSPIINQHQLKMTRIHSKNYPESSDEQNQSFIISPRHSSELLNDDTDPNGLLRRKTYQQMYQSTPSIREHQTQAASPFKCASNETLIRPRQQQQQIIPRAQTPSKDMTKKSKRFSTDPNHVLTTNQQQMPEPQIYRSSMVIVPEHNSNVYGVPINNSQTVPLTYKPTREEPMNELPQPRSKTRISKRDLFRNHSVNYQSPAETAAIRQRISSRQSHHQIAPDPMDQDDIESLVSTICQSSCIFEQQPQNNTYTRNPEPRKHIYGSDSLLNSSNGCNSSFSRLSFSSSKGEFGHTSKNVVVPQRDPPKPTKPNVPVYPKTPNESNRVNNKRQQSNNGLFGVYPLARTALSHVTNVFIPSSNQRQQSSRLSNTKSRHH